MRLSECTDLTLRVLMCCAAHCERLATIGELADPSAGAAAAPRSKPPPDSPVRDDSCPNPRITMSRAHVHLNPDSIYPFDARGVAKRFRHAAIFGALDSLQPGETMRFANDHDPLPLLEQVAQRYGEGVGVEYRHREPGIIVIDFSVR